MTEHVLSPRALADIEQIWTYTAERWDSEQADRYVRLLRQGIEAIARDPRRGRSCDDIRVGYRKYAVGSHILFFRMLEGRVYVVRILHQRMDFERHL
ncbi:MAG TPA: type II toxin-antitoxin system RelE/ParE family toxin [Xanthobacteraceae bacterium]|nr:type II toxin-antitoxin system RelE/ParE family toxin [Xanthobacteraceae bacterium]